MHIANNLAQFWVTHWLELNLFLTISKCVKLLHHIAKSWHSSRAYTFCSMTQRHRCTSLRPLPAQFVPHSRSALLLHWLFAAYQSIYTARICVTINNWTSSYFLLETYYAINFVLQPWRLNLLNYRLFHSVQELASNRQWVTDSSHITRLIWQANILFASFYSMYRAASTTY